MLPNIIKGAHTNNLTAIVDRRRAVESRKGAPDVACFRSIITPLKCRNPDLSDDPTISPLLFMPPACQAVPAPQYSEILHGAVLIPPNILDGLSRNTQLIVEAVPGIC